MYQEFGVLESDDRLLKANDLSSKRQFLLTMVANSMPMSIQVKIIE